MSITKFQDLMFKRGCGNAVLILCAAVFVGGMFYNCGRGAAANSQLEEKGKPIVIATVGKVDILEKQVSDAASQQTSRLAQQMGNGITTQIQGTVTALRGEIESAATLYLADRNKIHPTDAQIIAAVEDLNKQQILEELTRGGKINAGASDAEVDVAFKKLSNGKSVSEFVKSQEEKIKEALKDTSKRADLVALASRQLLLASFSDKTPMTDDQLRAQYDTYTVKRILFTDQAGAKETADERAKKALDEITSNKITFEAAIDKYSNDHPVPSKKLSENSVKVPGALLDSQPEYKALFGQKEGYVSPVITTKEGKLILKVVGVKSDAPKDFAKNAATLRASFTANKARFELQKQMDALFTDGTVKWKSPGYEALYAVASSLQSAGDPEAIKKAYAKAEAALTKNNGYDARAAAFASYFAQKLLVNFPGMDKAKMADEQMDTLKRLLDTTEDCGLRIELVNLAIAKKDGGLAAGQLAAAALGNSGTYDAVGQRNFGDINAKAEELLKAGLAKEADLKPVRDAQEKWRQGKADADKMAEDAKKREDEAKKANAELDKQNAEALKKQKEDAAKAGAGKK